MSVTYCDRCGKETESPIRTLCKKCWTELEEELLYPKTPYLTNADRIRSMTDEELAEMLNHAQGDGYLVGIGQRKISAYGNWLEWLKQEATDEHQSL